MKLMDGFGRKYTGADDQIASMRDKETNITTDKAKNIDRSIINTRTYFYFGIDFVKKMQAKALVIAGVKPRKTGDV